MGLGRESSSATILIRLVSNLVVNAITFSVFHFHLDIAHHIQLASLVWDKTAGKTHANMSLIIALYEIASSQFY